MKVVKYKWVDKHLWALHVSQRYISLWRLIHLIGLIEKLLQQHIHAYKKLVSKAKTEFAVEFNTNMAEYTRLKQEAGSHLSIVREFEVKIRLFAISRRKKTSEGSKLPRRKLNLSLKSLRKGLSSCKSTLGRKWRLLIFSMMTIKLILNLFSTVMCHYIHIL